MNRNTKYNPIITPDEEYLDWYTLNYGDPTDEELDLLYEEVWGQ